MKNENISQGQIGQNEIDLVNMLEDALLKIESLSIDEFEELCIKSGYKPTRKINKPIIGKIKMEHNWSIKYWNQGCHRYKFICKNNTPTGRYALYSNGTISIEIKETYEERYYIFFKKLKTRKILVPEDDIEFIEIYQYKGE